MARNNKNSKINEPKITHKILASIFRNKAARNAIEHRWRGQWTRALLMMARGRMKPIWRRRWKTKDDRTLYLIPRLRVFDSSEGGSDYDLNRIWLGFLFIMIIVFDVYSSGGREGEEEKNRHVGRRSAQVAGPAGVVRNWWQHQPRRRCMAEAQKNAPRPSNN